MNHTAIVPGSLKAIAQRDGQHLAESFLSADAIVIVDVSGSMASYVDGADPWERSTGRTAYQAACDELAKLQASLPGRVAVVAFSDDAAFCAGGVPPFQSGGTDLAKALRFVHPADGCDIRFIVISDGQPDDENAALQAAAKFKDKIDTVYIGQPGGPGQAFLYKLAAASGGTASRKTVQQLSDSVKLLMEATP